MFARWLWTQPARFWRGLADALAEYPDAAIAHPIRTFALAGCIALAALLVGFVLPAWVAYQGEVFYRKQLEKKLDKDILDRLQQFESKRAALLQQLSTNPDDA